MIFSTIKKVAVTVMFSAFSFAAFSQSTNVYSVFYNHVNEDFTFPLIGFVNTAKGDHKWLQLGFVNTNTGNFTGSQIGFVNTTAGSFSGAQIGFINTAAKEVNDIQLGFINTTADSLNGAQIGFVNTAVKEADGLQFGFINTAVKKLKGAQIGFVNYTDTIEKGIPIGFLSIVRHGGYMALEYGFSEFYPVTVGFKIGVEKFYTSFFAAYSPAQEVAANSFALGAGLGSIIPVSGSFFFNPEVNTLHSLGSDDDNQQVSLVTFFGYSFNRHFSITAGPSVTWSHCGKDGSLPKSLFSIVSHEINARNNLVVGARLGVRYRF
jgi:hypothetical protein